MTGALKMIVWHIAVAMHTTVQARNAKQNWHFLLLASVQLFCK
jgi:hypothetical protein